MKPLDLDALDAVVGGIGHPADAPFQPPQGSENQRRWDAQVRRENQRFRLNNPSEYMDNQYHLGNQDMNDWWARGRRPAP